MATFRTYRNTVVFSEDYYKVRAFLVKARHVNYPFGRWDWMITHGYLDSGALDRIGLWEENGELVAMATFDCQLGQGFFITLPGYDSLKREMLLYAKTALAKPDGSFSAMIDEADEAFLATAAAEGFVETGESDADAVLDITEEATLYTLPEGFGVTSLADRYDLYQYGLALWKGFNHEGEGPFLFPVEKAVATDAEMRRPNVDLNLKIAVVSPSGEFVSYCGMWKDPASEDALVEPVATAPKYRRMGLGRAAVLEAVRRCGALGAKRAFVGSSQQFYYSIGFRPYSRTKYLTWQQD